MGEVYRATDTRLAREVAIKVLPESFYQDKERLARFEREAKTLATLNHPNIAGIYGLEQIDNTQALILELVEGEDLSHRLKSGAVPVDEALQIGKQIAAALEAAHEKGIIHRDLKPGNIKISEDGRVTVLDFGLAKSLSDESTANSMSSAEDSPTITDVFTKPGTILGTAAYMSPEQARGKKVDQRTDIWAFGCVLFECLTGKRAFSGEDTTETLASIIKGDPNWALLPEQTNLSLKWLLKRCLAKSRKQRIQHIGDARIELEQQDLNNLVEKVGKESQGPFPLWRKWAWMGVALLMFIAGYIIKPNHDVPPPIIQQVTTKKLEFLLGKNQFLNFESGRAFRISPDGTRLAYVVKDEKGDSSSILHLRHLDQLKSESLDIDVQNNAFAFSPDGEFIAFAHDEKLKTIATERGGDIKYICNARAIYDVSWEADGHLYFSKNHDRTSIYRVSENGGSPVPVTKPAEGDFFHFDPHLLPDSKGLLYTIGTSYSNQSKDLKLMFQPLPDGEAKLLKEFAHSGRYDASKKKLLYVSDSILYCVDFDLNSQELIGDPHVLANDLLAGAHLYSGYYYDISTNGLLCYLTGYNSDDLYQFEWIDRAGESHPLNLDPKSISDAALSPDGRRLAYTQKHERDHQSDIHIYDFQTDTSFNFTSSPENEWKPTWSPSGESLIYTSNKEDGADIFWRRLNLEGEGEILLQREGMQGVWDWHPEGKYLSVFSSFNLIVIELEGNDKLGWSYKNDLKTNIPESVYYGVSFSPDWKWFAYLTPSGPQSIFVKPFNEDGGQQHLPLNINNIQRPQWSADGETLLFCGQPSEESESLQIYSIGWDKEKGQFASTLPVPWKNAYTANRSLTTFFQYDAKSDRILVMKKVETAEDLQLNHVILHENFHDAQKTDSDF